VEFTSRVATAADGAVLRVITDAAIGELQKGFLTDEQIGSSRAIMGIDNQLIADGTYYVVESGSEIAGCGGWSGGRRCMAAMPRQDATATSSTRSAMLRGCGRCTRTHPSPGEESAG
jgi:hypothetical protein